MADTLGSLVDKLCTVDMKMWNAQEFLYRIRKMTYEEFEEEFVKVEGGPRKLWDWLMKACDLNVQRNQLINEVDLKVIELIEQAMAGKQLDDGANVQRHHKTY